MLYKIINFLLFILFFVFLAPTSVARFLVGAIYLAILLSYTNFFQKPYRLIISILFGLLVIFPFLHQFRYLNELDLTKISFNLDFSFFQEGHFDAYQNFVRLLSIDLITFGYELVGTILFYIPRSLWEDKPIGSGHELAKIAHLSYDNISMPLIGEGYINFGVIGIVIFTILIGIIFSYLDKLYWTLKEEYTNHWFYNIYYLFIGLSSFILRGELLSSFAYTVAIIGTYVFLLFILKNFLKIRV